MNSHLCVVLHDVASSTLQMCERVIHAVDEVAPVPITLLTVPRYHCEPASPHLRQWLVHRQAVGDEIALHGYTHQDDGTPRHFIDALKRRHYTRGEGEFCGLDAVQAKIRLHAGMRWLARQGLRPHGFVAPAWLMSEGTWEALSEQPFGYTCTLRQLVLLPERTSLVSQSIVYSCDSAWRRQASLIWAGAVAAAERNNPVLRLELHPRDADHPAIRRSWQGLLERHLLHRRASTLHQTTEHFRAMSQHKLSAPSSINAAAN
jgi:predicted deacetylase